MSTPQPDASSGPVQYRIVVRSAAEAVALVRERFGESARVVAVRQIEAGGLARFLQRPRLEVIVEVHSASTTHLEARSDELALPESPEANDGVEPHGENPGSGNEGKEEEPRAYSPVRAPIHQFSVLRATGLDDLLLERIRSDHPDFQWERTSAPEALSRLAAWLKKQYKMLPERSCGSRCVFIGPCGAGKTSALCKTLALDVFVRGREAAVLKLDGEVPNASDGLAAFCDVLGVPLLRSAAEIDEFDADSLVYIDLPGIGLDAEGEQRRLVQTLDALNVETRILVVNAGWETELIADAYGMGRACGATHVFFTHMDEVRRPAKLWRFVLFGGLRPIASSSGPSPAGEFDEDAFSALLARTVPPSMARAAGCEGGRA